MSEIPQNAIQQTEYGKISTEVLTRIAEINKTIQGLAPRALQILVEQAKLSNAILGLEDEGQTLLSTEASRLGVPPNSQFRVQPDGTVVGIAFPAPAAVQPAPAPASEGDPNSKE